MSLSTISSVNKYLLSSSGPYVPPPPTLKQANMLFPDSFGTMTTYMNNAYNHDCRMTFSSTMNGAPWRDVANGYQILISSYGGYNNVTPNNIFPAHEMFDGYTTTFWFPNFAGNPFPITYKLDGVDQGYVTQTQYSANGQTYIGGGAPKYFFTTIYNTGSVSGEFIQFKFPFKALFKGLDFKCRDNSSVRCVKACRILGSDNGTTWFYITDLTFGAYTNGTFQSRTYTDTAYYSYIRIVIISTQSNANLNVGQCRLKFDAYA